MSILDLFRRKPVKRPIPPANAPTQKPIVTSEIFVAGPTPTVTFVDRSTSPEFKELSNTLQQRGRIISLTGPSKSGKTVISVNQVLRDRRPVQVHGVKIDSVDAFWNALRGELRLPRITSRETVEAEAVSKTGGGSLSIGTPEAGAAIGGGITKTHEKADTVAGVYDADSVAEIEAKLRELRSPIVIDDFHWIASGDLQVRLIKSLRPLLQSGTSVILTSVTELNSSALRATPDLALLHTSVKVPTWSFEQLVRIGRLGFDALNVGVSDRVMRTMARYSYRNPMLMQEYCSRLAYALDIEQALPVRKEVEVSDTLLEATLKAVAEDKVRIYGRYCDNRGDTSWTLSSGSSVNMNQLIFLALSRVWVMTPIGMDTLARRIRRLLSSETDRARINTGLVTANVRRISDEMLRDLETRTPIALDPETGQLNILDPFFKAYLNWQLSPRLLNEQPPLTPAEPDETLER